MRTLLSLIVVVFGSVPLIAGELKIGTVNFASCVTDSKLGKQEQTSFENVRKQFMTLFEDTEKQLRETGEKLQDKDALDGMSKEAEEELRGKAAQLNDDLVRYQQQYQQLMNQGQYKMMQTILSSINQASEEVARHKGLVLVLNKEACFFASHDYDITADIVHTMDVHFDKEKQ